MPFSLQPADPIQHPAPLFDRIELSELDAVPKLDRARCLQVEAPRARLDDALDRRLRELGFVETPRSWVQLTDLEGLRSAEDYLVSHLSGRARNRVRSSARRFAAAGGKCHVMPLDQAGSLLTRAYLEVVLPHASSTGISPYRITHAARYQAQLDALHSQPSMLVALELDQRLVAVSLASATRLDITAAQYPHETRGDFVWSSPLQPERRAFASRVNAVFCDPPSPLESAVSAVMWLQIIDWCVSHGVTVLTGGPEGGPCFHGRYCRVLHHKKRWGLSSAAVVSRTNRIYQRLPLARVLETGLQHWQMTLDTEGQVLIRAVLPNADFDKLLLKADPHFRKEIVCASADIARQARRCCEADGVDVTVASWD